MKLAKVNEGNEVLEYPCSVFQVRREFPNVSFPFPITQDCLTSYGYVIVKENKPPTGGDQTLFDLVSNAEFIKEEWVEMWSRSAVSEEETTARVQAKLASVDYRGFWKAFIRSNSYSTLKVAAGTNLASNVLATELISVFSDAKTGNVDVEAMQTGISEALTALETVDPALKTETEGLIRSFGMDYYLPS